MLAPIKMMAVSSPSGIASFTSSGTHYWTPPSGVTSVTITGRGGSKSSAYYTWSTLSNIGTRMLGGSGFPDNVGPTLSYTRIRSDESSLISSVNAITTSSTGQSTTVRRLNSYYWDSAGSYWSYSASTYTGVVRRVGTLTANSTLAAGSGNFPNGGTGSYYLGGGSIQSRATNYDYGTDSTGLGYTFPDDAAQAEYTNVAVVPQQQYTIVVGDNEGSAASFVTIEWG